MCDFMDAAQNACALPTITISINLGMPKPECPHPNKIENIKDFRSDKNKESSECGKDDSKDSMNCGMDKSNDLSHIKPSMPEDEDKDEDKKRW